METERESRRTLHVGNLSYKMTEENLEKLFSKFGKISQVYIVQNRNRPSSYGFVEYDTEEEARNALSNMNQSIVDDNEIRVDFSNGAIVKGSDRDDRDDNQPPRRFPPRGRGRGRFRGRGRGRFRGRGVGRFRGGFRGRSRGRGFRGRGVGRFRGRGGFRGRSRGRGFRGRGRFRGRGGFRRFGGPRGGRFNSRRDGPRGESPSSDQEKTTATLFVANLPYEIDDEGLAQLFSKLPEFKTAHVVRSMRGKPRGYGFVEFQSEIAQLTALKEMDGKNIEGKYGERKIMVKVATKRGQEEEHEHEPEEKSNE